ncbi:VanW family protein [Metabacillus herbersteinensis]|uniref:VanW family protein n=1 Tax=Metabacillus herbersteinensis TaxID=283816 RepID=A0ABV6G917_9BACI
MRIKNQQKAFLVLAFSTLFIFSFSQIGASAYTYLFKGSNVKQGTMNASNDLTSSLETAVYEVNSDDYELQDQLPKTIISESKIGLDNQNSNDLKDKLQSAVVQPGQTFSFQSYLDENQLDALESGFLNRVATAIYTAILPTNLQIIERHISSELPEYAELGKEANFKPNQRDLIFFNPDTSDIEVTFLITDEMLSVQIKGITTEGQFKVVVENEKAFSANTIIQYDSSLPELGKKVVSEGKKGQSVTVKRLLVQNDNSQLEIVLSEDFYAPIHRVEKHGLKKAESYTLPNEVEGNTVDENGQPFLPPEIEIPNQSPNVTQDNSNQGGMNGDARPSTSEENNTDRLWEKPEVLK